MSAFYENSKRQDGNTHLKATDAKLMATSSIKKHSTNNQNNKTRNTTRKRFNYNNLNVKQQLTYAICFILTAVISSLVQVQSAAVYLNGDFRSHPRFGPLCNPQQEQFIESEGKESSLILEFKPWPGAITERKKSCTRILSAPNGYGFIVRLILPKIRRGHHHATALTAASSEENANSSSSSSKTKLNKLNNMTSIVDKLNNATENKAVVSRKCPMSIFSSLDPHTAQWRVDPCQLEDTAPEMEDPVRLFHGRVRIVWEHDNQHLHSKLMVTVLAKGEQCRNDNKHQCLKIGDEPILCISKELECDGIRHCPVSNEYDSDEDYKMCWKRRRFSESLPPTMESEIFEHFAMEVFRNLFAFDAPQMPDTALAVGATTSIGNSSNVPKLDNDADDISMVFLNVNNSTESTNSHGKRNNTRSGLHSDLSKYGPWGYLMLGMLLCGGALLICGLWGCFCRLTAHIQSMRSFSASASQNAVNNEREAALQQGATAGSSSDQSSNMAPPNYDELDPPPAYSVLFPNQKTSNATLNSLAGSTDIAAVTTPQSPNSVPSCSGSLPENPVPSSSQLQFSIGNDDSAATANESTN